MFRFTIRDVLWLTVVVALTPPAAEAQTTTFKKGDRVYVKYLNMEGYGVVTGINASGYEIERENLPSYLRRPERFPRNSVYESLEHAKKGQLPQERHPLPDLAPLYQAIGAAMGFMCMAGLIVAAAIYAVRQRLRKPKDQAINADVLT
jgi:hypothetical protein